MPGKHKNTTISFRPSAWQKALIDERVMLSGLYKKDFITRSCIYSKIVMLGSEENIIRIINELQVMENVLLDIANQIKLNDISLTQTAFTEMKEEYLALIITIVDIINGTSHLFNIEKTIEEADWKEKFNTI